MSTGPDILKFEHKIVIIFLSISLNMFFGAQKNRLIEMVLLRNPQHYVFVKKEENNFQIGFHIWRPVQFNICHDLQRILLQV